MIKNLLDEYRKGNRWVAEKHGVDFFGTTKADVCRSVTGITKTADAIWEVEHSEFIMCSTISEAICALLSGHYPFELNESIMPDMIEEALTMGDFVLLGKIIAQEVKKF